MSSINLDFWTGIVLTLCVSAITSTSSTAMSCYARWMHATMLACCAVCMFCLVVIALRFYVAYSIVSCNVLSRIDSKEFKSTPAYCCLNCAFPNHCGMRLYISRALSYNFTQQMEMCAIARAQPVNTTQKQKQNC